MHHALYGHVAELVAVCNTERSATDVDPIINTDSLNAGDAFSSEEDEENEKEASTLEGERELRGSQFIVNQCTIDLCQYASLVRACLTEGEVRMIEIAFGRKALMYGLNCITQGWDIQQRELCCNCGRPAINKCCEGTTLTWVSCDVVQQLTHLWSRIETAVHEIWKSVRQDIVVDSPGSHGRLNKMIKNESSPAIHLLLSSDGVQVSGTREKVWPVLLSVLNIYRKQRMLKKNVIIVGIISGIVDPSPAIFSEVIELVQIQLRRFSCVAGVSAQISAIVGDKPAIAKMFNFAHHSSAGSCSYCECMDTRIKINRGKEDTLPLDSSLASKDHRNHLDALLPYVKDRDRFRNVSKETVDYLQSVIRPDAEIDVSCLNDLTLPYNMQMARFQEYTVCSSLLSRIQSAMQKSKPRIIGAVRDGARLVAVDLLEMFQGGFDYRRIVSSDLVPLVYNDPVLGVARTISDIRPISIFPRSIVQTVKKFVRCLINQLWTEEQFDQISSPRKRGTYPELDDATIFTFSKAMLLGFQQNPANKPALLSLALVVKDCIARIRDDRRTAKKRKIWCSMSTDNGQSSIAGLSTSNVPLNHVVHSIKAEPSASTTRLAQLAKNITDTG